MTDALEDEFVEDVYALLVEIPTLTFTSAADLFANWPNPFYHLSSAPLIATQETLAIVDGGESGQFNPIFPFLIPEYDVSVILVNDNDGDTTAGYANCAELRYTYEAAFAAGLVRMPFVPTVDVFNATGALIFLDAEIVLLQQVEISLNTLM